MAEFMQRAGSTLLTGPMSLWKPALAIVGLTLAPLAALAGTHGFAMFSPRSDVRISSEGTRRDAVLAGITTKYVSEGSLVTAPMRTGAQYAPMGFLNLMLKQQGEKWRVSSVKGTNVETFDVS